MCNSQHTVLCYLIRYISLAESRHDLPSCTKFHAFHTLLFAHHRARDVSLEAATSMLASAAYVLAWHQGAGDAGDESDDEDDAGADGDEDEDDDGDGRREDNVDQGRDIAEDGRTPNEPLHAVYEGIQGSRGDVVAWLARAKQAERDAMLHHVAAIAMHRAAVPEHNWESSSTAPVVCFASFESAHPYRHSGGRWERRLRFPGAEHISLTFDAKCCTREGDLLTVYKDNTLTASWGAFGGTTKPW